MADAQLTNGLLRPRGAGAQRVTAAVRQVTKVIGHDDQTVNISATSPANTFLDQLGTKRSYVEKTFKVPAGADRLAASVAWQGPVGQIVRLSLLDPQGAFISQWSTATGSDLDSAGIVAVDAHNDLYLFAYADVTASSGDTVRVFVLKKFRQP